MQGGSRRDDRSFRGRSRRFGLFVGERALAVAGIDDGIRLGQNDGRPSSSARSTTCPEERISRAPSLLCMISGWRTSVRRLPPNLAPKKVTATSSGTIAAAYRA